MFNYFHTTYNFSRFLSLPISFGILVIDKLLISLYKLKEKD